MELFYKKNKNKEVFSNLETVELGNFKHMQNYMPIYSRFFEFNDTNWNSINLNHSKRIQSISEKEDDNNYLISFGNGKLNQCFFKLAPLIDPVKYMVGKYKDISNNEDYVTTILPKYNVKTIEKIDNVNNMAYTDGFFTYLSSKLKNNYNNPHCIDFYGSYLGIKQQYKFNIYDDLEFLYESEYFSEKMNTLFKLNGDIDNDLFNFNTRKNKNRLKFDKTIDNVSICENIEFDDVFEENEDNSSNIIQLSDISLLEEYIPKDDDSSLDIKTSVKDNNTDSVCSSRSSCTSGSESSESNNEQSEDEEESQEHTQQDQEDSDDDDDDDDDSDDSDDSDEYLEAEIPQFPVQIIAMEKLVMTLDKYIDLEYISKEEWLSIFMQIFMNLLTYKAAFNFTHNDLHTNNVMFYQTDKEYLYYKFNKKFYKVPTFGKIYKIIDFGRSIYTFKGELICSDSYHPKGDAATQFNFGPYLNENKPIVEPNYSFDLCRLACSLYDNFVDDSDVDEGDFDDKEEMRDYLEKKKVLKDIEELVKEWCTDDNNNNVLYKSSGKERYPGFKLYKMITRTVHKHTPEAQLEKPLFRKFVVKMRNINRKELINIDVIKSEI